MVLACRSSQELLAGEGAPKMERNGIGLLSAIVIIAAIVYASAMWNAVLCFKVPGCPAVRRVVLGY
jgi:hypothetical protein